MIDYRAKGIKAKPEYVKISQEVTVELSQYPDFGDMDNLDLWFVISCQIEQRFG